MTVCAPRLDKRFQHGIAYCEVLSSMIELSHTVNNSRRRSSSDSMRLFKTLDCEPLVVQDPTAHGCVKLLFWFPSMILIVGFFEAHGVR